MRLIADLHVHSHYSRATSKDMSPEGIWKWAQLKGVNVIGTGDFTHPGWLKELSEKLEPAGRGLFKLKKEYLTDDVPESCKDDVYFLLSAEISCIYSKGGKTRKVHSIILAPDFTSAARLNLSLSKIGNLNADGRPILGLGAKELLKITLDASSDNLYIPAHAWTPHFSIFGAASGFDSLEECYEELTPHIPAIETGLSSDPLMNWRLSTLDRITLVSNSDAHSAPKIGREANILDTEISYDSLMNAIKTRKGFLGTIEFFPEEGKYHYDGHRNCGVSLSPKETIHHDYLCPVCGKKLTVGVMHRVEKLADREHGFKPADAPAFTSIIPLPEIIAEGYKCGVSTKKVDSLYFRLLAELGNEFRILLGAPLDDIERAGTPLLREAISRMRAGNVHIAPGYDGEYGKIRIFEEMERKGIKGQLKLL
ncbi:MAG TPA: endonuclease Q family protein [Nitrospirota bacterium]|nr:endonuclease Q family protein [Nitrospirota bacterium]